MENKPQNVFEKLDKQGEQIDDISSKLEGISINDLYAFKTVKFTKIYKVSITTNIMNALTNNSIYPHIMLFLINANE